MLLCFILLVLKIPHSDAKPIVRHQKGALHRRDHGGTRIESYSWSEHFDGTSSLPYEGHGHNYRFHHQINRNFNHNKHLRFNVTAHGEDKLPAVVHQAAVRGNYQSGDNLNTTYNNWERYANASTTEDGDDDSFSLATPSEDGVKDNTLFDLHIVPSHHHGNNGIHGNSSLDNEAAHAVPLQSHEPTPGAPPMEEQVNQVDEQVEQPMEEQEEPVNEQIDQDMDTPMSPQPEAQTVSQMVPQLSPQMASQMAPQMVPNVNPQVAPQPGPQLGLDMGTDMELQAPPQMDAQGGPQMGGQKLGPPVGGPVGLPVEPQTGQQLGQQTIPQMGHPMGTHQVPEFGPKMVSHYPPPVTPEMASPMALPAAPPPVVAGGPPAAFPLGQPLPPHPEMSHLPANVNLQDEPPRPLDLYHGPPQMDLHHGPMNLNMTIEEEPADTVPEAKMNLYHGPVNTNPNRAPTLPCKPCTINCNELDSTAFRQNSECDSTAVPGNP